MTTGHWCNWVASGKGVICNCGGWRQCWIHYVEWVTSAGRCGLFGQPTTQPAGSNSSAQITLWWYKCPLYGDCNLMARPCLGQKSWIITVSPVLMVTAMGAIIIAVVSFSCSCYVVKCTLLVVLELISWWYHGSCQPPSAVVAVTLNSNFHEVRNRRGSIQRRLRSFHLHGVTVQWEMKTLKMKKN